MLRLWLPDRPGALGQVASRIGAVRGDVVGIDILERGEGQAIDELVVELPRTVPLDLLVDEIRQVDGVGVEEVRRAEGSCDPRLDALEAVAQLVGADDLVDLYDGVVSQCRHVIKTAWAVLVDIEPDGQEIAARHGDAPSGAWLRAFIAGSSAASSSGSGEVAWAPPQTPDEPRPRNGWSSGDVAWAPLPASGLALVVGRTGPPFRAREVRQLAALARVADTRRRELVETHCRAEHPSARSHT